ncbi:MAG: response regulator [Nitrospirae bacterium]|nr:response regulator [Nitrospirota bacterium]
MAKKLLVVDQNLAVHRLLDFTLSKEGFQIVAVEDGLAALDQAYQDAPALIMVNSQLDGLPLSMFVKKVRERDTLRTTPIILMAQSSDELNMEQLRRSGITDVVKKPLDAMEINATISRCIPQSGPTAPAAVHDRQPAGAAPNNASHSGSTEEDQDMAQMEQLLGWVPREHAGPPGKSAAPPPPRSAPPPPAPQMPDAQITNAPFEFELQDPMAEAVAASPAAPPENAIPVQENAISMDDLLIGSDALLYQPPVEAAPPPPPPPPEPEPEPESDLPAELQVVMSAKAPIPVKAQARPAPPKAASPQTPPLDLGGPDEMSREETERLVRATVEELTRKLAQETIERITKELVPELAERAVRAEIERLKAESPSTD